MNKNLLHGLCSAVLILLSIAVNAQIPNAPQLKSVMPLPSGIKKSSSILSPELGNLSDSLAPHLQAVKTTKPLFFNSGLNKYLQIKGDKVVVDITVKGDNNNKRALAELEKMGFRSTGTFGRVLSGTIPIKALSSLEATTNIRFAKPAYKPLHQSIPFNTSAFKEARDRMTRPVVTQGDTALRAYIGREKYHVNGKGVKVGIISDSYNNLGTADIGVANGELPGPGNPYNFTTPVEILQDLDGGGTDEGRGMAEIIHDVAPGADLAFYTAFLGEASFAQGIQDLAAAGCKVINDDVQYFDEPFFQDGIVAQSVDIAKQKGVTYFSAAGNHGSQSYESNYRPSNYFPFGPDYGEAHNFSAPQNDPIYFQPYSLPTYGTFIASFQWDQPYYSAGGDKGCQSDFDIYLLDINGNIVAAATTNNIASGDPVEILGYFNGTTNNIFFLVIVKYTGSDVARLKYVNFGAQSFLTTFPEIPGRRSPTLVGHAKAAGAIATAAAPFYTTPAYGINPPVVEGFSAVGGVPNYFDKKGNRISPLIRQKPEVTSIDGGNTSFFPPASLFGANQDIPEDTDTFPNFFGTSAAAPHAAGVAALMIEAHKLGPITPDQIKAALISNTVDMDNIKIPGFQTGFDFNTGYGLILADAAIGAVAQSMAGGRVMTDETIDAKTIDKLNTAEVYPNPSTTSFRVYLSLAKSQNVNLELYSSDGKKIFEKISQASGIVDIDATHYKRGLYILKVKQGEFTKTFKLIKQ